MGTLTPASKLHVVTAFGSAVLGASSGRGVSGISDTGPGVWGESISGAAVRGSASTGFGVRGLTQSGDGVRGDSDTGTGVRGRVDFAGSSSAGVSGRVSNDSSGAGVEGSHFGSGEGVRGVSSFGIGVLGTSSGSLPADRRPC